MLSTYHEAKHDLSGAGGTKSGRPSDPSTVKKSPLKKKITNPFKS